MKKIDKIPNPDPVYFQLFPTKISKGDRRRFKIIESVIEIIGTKGVKEITFDAIGKKVGLPRSNIAYHFPNIDELIISSIRYVVSYGQAITVEYVKKATSPIEQILFMGAATIDWLMFKKKDHAPTMLLFYYYGSFDSGFQEFVLQTRRVGADRISAILGSIKGSSELPSRDLHMRSIKIQSIITGLAMDFILRKDLKREEMEEIMNSALMNELKIFL
ncbi:MAG: TetR/AcrR family transcriptional regulator [Bacteriovoracaceae bacterium]